MVDFSIQYDKDSDFVDYLAKFKTNIVKATFLDVKLILQEDFAFFHIKPLYFPFWVFSPFLWTAIYIFRGGLTLPTFILGGIPFLSYPFYNKYWYIMMLYIGKWKGKYRGKFQLL